MFLWHSSAQCEQVLLLYRSIFHVHMRSYPAVYCKHRPWTCERRRHFCRVAFFNPRAKITISFSFVIGGITIKRITWLYSNSLLFCCSIKQNCFQNHLSYQTTVMRDFTKSFLQMSIIMFIPLLSVDINVHF